MSIKKLVLIGLPALAMVSVFMTAKPAVAAPFQPVSIWARSTGNSGSTNYWHRRHHRHHHSGIGVNIHL
jgi:hypothetical protein